MIRKIFYPFLCVVGLFVLPIHLSAESILEEVDQESKATVVEKIAKPKRKKGQNYFRLPTLEQSTILGGTILGLSSLMLFFWDAMIWHSEPDKASKIFLIALLCLFGFGSMAYMQISHHLLQPHPKLQQAFLIADSSMFFVGFGALLAMLILTTNFKPNTPTFWALMGSIDTIFFLPAHATQRGLILQYTGFTALFLLYFTLLRLKIDLTQTPKQKKLGYFYAGCDIFLSCLGLLGIAGYHFLDKTKYPSLYELSYYTLLFVLSLGTYILPRLRSLVYALLAIRRKKSLKT